MAKLPQGPFGPFIGKLNTLVGASWKGTPYVRSLPRKTNKAPTEQQSKNTSKFKFLNDFLRPFHHFTSIGLSNSAKKMSTANLAFSLNHRHVLLDPAGDLQFDFHNLIWSKGTLPQLQLPLIKIDQSALVTLTWSFTFKKHMSYTDQLMLLIYCPALHLTDGFIGGVNRIDKRCTFKINPTMLGTAIHIYLGLTSLDRKSASDNQYLGAFILS